MTSRRLLSQGAGFPQGPLRTMSLSAFARNSPTRPPVLAKALRRKIRKEVSSGAGIRLSLLQRHIAGLPEVVSYRDKCLQIDNSRKRQRRVYQQGRSRLVAQSYGQSHRREHYRRDQLSVDHLLPQDDDRDESQNGHQRPQSMRQRQRDRQREVIAHHDAPHEFLHRVIILVKERKERGERGRDQQIVSV